MAEWFVPRRFGWGARPNSWQGWTITVVFALIIIAATQFLARSPWAANSVIVTSMIIFILIVINNTRGSLRWRWGKGDKS